MLFDTLLQILIKRRDMFPSSEKNELLDLAIDESQRAENFKNWFGGSKAVDSSGAPLKLFHGTKVAFTTFNMERARDGAHFFCEDESHAESFGKAQSFFVRIENPLIISDDDLYDEWDNAHPDGNQDERHLLPRHFVHLFVEKAWSSGCDGLIIRDMGDRDISVDMYLPLSASQIKSAESNVGLFDIESEDFTDVTSLKNRTCDSVVDNSSSKPKFRP